VCPLDIELVGVGGRGVIGSVWVVCVCGCVCVQHKVAFVQGDCNVESLMFLTQRTQVSHSSALWNAVSFGSYLYVWSFLLFPSMAFFK
jgi:hypothetical protein